MVLLFSQSTTSILNSRQHFYAVGNSFLKDYIFRKIVLNSKNVILEDFFNTPFSTPQNGFGKLLINWQIYTQFII
jgi:hypothetical protein